MKEFDFGKDIISFISILITLIAFVLTIISPEETNRFLIPLLITFLLALAIYIINYVVESLKEHNIELKKLNEKLNIHKEINELKAKVEFLSSTNMKKKGNTDFIELIIRIIQIGIIMFAVYVILKVIGVKI